MGGEVLPPLDTKLILDVEKRLTLLFEGGGGGSGASGTGGTDNIINIIAGKPFSTLMYTSQEVLSDLMENGFSLEVVSTEKGIVRLSGIALPVGEHLVEFSSGHIFIIKAVREPSSDSVEAVLD